MTGLNVCVKATFLFGVPICVSVNEPAAKLTITVPSTKRPVKKYFQLYVPAIGETVVSVTPTAPGPLSVSSLPSIVFGLMSLPVVPVKVTTTGLIAAGVYSSATDAWIEGKGKVIVRP